MHSWGRRKTKSAFRDPFRQDFAEPVSRDPNANTTRITQANGVATDYAYDALNRLVSVTTHPDAQTNLTTSYALDGNGQPTSRTTADGVTVSHAYDALSRLTSVTAASLSITYAYDALGRRTRMTDGTGTTAYAYDGLGRLTQVAAPNGALAYAYDFDGNRTRLVYPNGDAVFYAYSPGGRLAGVTDWAGRLSRYGYFPSGLVRTTSLPNQLLATYAYDRAQRLTQLSYTLGRGLRARPRGEPQRHQRLRAGPPGDPRGLDGANDVGDEESDFHSDTRRRPRRSPRRPSRATSTPRKRRSYENLTTELVIRTEKTEVSALFAALAALLTLLGGALSLVWFSRLP